MMRLLTFLAVIQCASGSFISQPQSTVKVQPGLSTSLECHVHVDGIFSVFWIKIHPNEVPACIAIAQTFFDVKMCEQFKNHSRIKVSWNQKIFNLSFSSVEQADTATYLCGTYTYSLLFFGNGTKLSLKELADDLPKQPIKDGEENSEKMQISEYLVPALAATNAASIFLIVLLCHLLRKKRSGVTAELGGADDNKTDEVNYAALNFGNKQRRTVQKRTSVETTVIYGAVRHQEEL